MKIPGLTFSWKRALGVTQMKQQIARSTGIPTSRCRLDFDSCGHYDHTDPALCSHFVKPIDNSKMFARWYKFSGRIGRLEYAITLVMAIVLYFFILLGVGQILQATGNQIKSETGLYIFSIGCMIPSVYLAIAAGVKRTHDTRVSSWYSLVPLIPLFS